MSIQTYKSEVIAIIAAALDLDPLTPVYTKSMAESMTATFSPPHQRSAVLDKFSEKLNKALIDVGAKVIPYDEALTNDGKFLPGLVVIEQGEGADPDLAINRVRYLRETCLVGIYDRPCPAEEFHSPQEKLDSVVELLAWNFTHIPIFLSSDSWTFASMNGAIVNCGSTSSITEAVMEQLIPKLAAPIRPPKTQDILYKEGALDINSTWYQRSAEDFVEAGNICRKNGLMHAHTSLESISFRNPFLKKLASAYLDKRTGMSYGFLAKQLPCLVTPAVSLADSSVYAHDINWANTPLVKIDGDVICRVSLGGEWVVSLPAVSVLCTRSGCDKTNISPAKDLVLMSLVDGKISLETAPGVRSIEARPSYDTLAILSHALGNAIGASVLSAIDPTSEFARSLRNEGISILHWHGYPLQGSSPSGYVVHGESNPPVSCSTYQSAIYAILGKFSAIESAISQNSSFLGDLHIEPHHGANLIGIHSLAQTALWVDEHH